MTNETEVSKTTVLVIEDDRDDYYLTNDTLQSIDGQPYRVSWSGSFEAAQQLLAEHEFDVALVDYQIGKKTGLDFISEVGPHYPNCPMILLTGLRSNEIDRAAQAAGAADYLPKELLSAEFLDRTIRYTRQHSQRWSLLNSILTTAASGMVAVDLEMKPIVWNVEALRALDIPKRASAVLWEEVAMALSRLPGEESLPSEFNNRLGQTFEVKVTDVSGVGQVIAFHDISKRAEAEALLLRAVKEAKESTQEKSKFLATMSHELRTPLNGILGMVNVMQRGSLDEQHQASVEIIKSCSEGLLHMINDLLDLSKIEAGAMKITNADFDLCDMVESTAQLLAPTAFSNDLEFTMFLDPALSEKIRGDALRTKQILINLIGNAIKFTSSGSVHVSVTSVQSFDQRMIQFDVIDSGPGIAEEQQRDLFKRFKQLDGGSCSNVVGTGLGLALCKELVSLMDGEIGCTSTLGQGSCFWFSIPDPTPNLDHDVINRRMRHELADASLLVVTREDAVRNAVSAYINALGGQVRFADDKDSAIAALEEYSCDHVIWDGHDLDPEPVSLIEHVRKANGSGTSRIWQLQSREQNARAADCPFDDVLPRPLTASSIKRIVKSLGSRSSSVTSKKDKMELFNNEVEEGGLRVLVAEDNLASQLVAKAMLTGAGYSVDIASDGDQAISMSLASQYDAILMDVCMPGTDGLEATRQIRQSKQNSDALIIATTADITTDSEAFFREVGMDYHCLKPLDWDKIISILKKLNDTAYATEELSS